MCAADIFLTYFFPLPSIFVVFSSFVSELARRDHKLTAISQILGVEREFFSCFLTSPFQNWEGVHGLEAKEE